MGVEFDPNKDAENTAKHGVSLTEGDGVLGDPLCLTVEDVSSEGERRWVSIGTNVFASLELCMLWSGPNAVPTSG